MCCIGNAGWSNVATSLASAGFGYSVPDFCNGDAGWSNVATSLAGAGFTGSYIFSQTIFTMRAGVHSRINGFVIAAMMFVIFVAPFSVVEYLPSYFFGSLMMWIGWEIARVR